MTAQLGGEITNFKRKRLGLDDDNELRADYLTIYLEDQIFGVPVLQVQDVLNETQFTRVPLAQEEVAGALNLRGRIVTAINVRQRLGLPLYDGKANPLSVVVEHEGELYSLVIDSVGDVISIKEREIQDNPPTLDPLWHDISTGIYRMEGKLLLVLDVAKLLDSVH
jgi:purine-binding chemotaxis protein CheW